MLRSLKPCTPAVLLVLLLSSGTAGAEPRVLRQVGIAELSPPPGEIVYVRELAAKRTDLFATRTDGSATRRLTKTPAPEFDPAVSPDGRRLAFSRRLPGTIGWENRSEI